MSLSNYMAINKSNGCYGSVKALSTGCKGITLPADRNAEP